MSGPVFDGEPSELLPKAVNEHRRGQWAMVEAWLKAAPEAEVDAWLDAHRNYRGPSCGMRTYHLRRAVRLEARDGPEAARAWLRAAHDSAQAEASIAAAEARVAAYAPRAIDRAVDGTFAAALVLPVGGVATLAAFVGGGAHAAAGTATFVAGMALLQALGAAMVARRAR